MRVPIRSCNLDQTVADVQNRDIKGPASEVVNRDGLVFLLIQAVGKSSCRRLVDNALNVESGNLAGIFRGLTLRVIEICRDYDCALNSLIKEEEVCSQLPPLHCSWEAWFGDPNCISSDK